MSYNKRRDYFKDLYNRESYGDKAVLVCTKHPEKDLQLVLRAEVETAVAILKTKWIINIPSEFIIAERKSR